MANQFTPEQIAQILEAFFDAVGTRQYIGARYVPIFGRKGETSIIWDNSAPYEPLTIVLYQGNSYTSRQYVPEGVEITNEDFWVITGNYNAQVEMYRRETAAAKQAADDAQQAVDSAQNDIDTLLPKSAFSEKTVRQYIDDAQQAADDAQNDIDSLLPKNAFLNTTVKDYIDTEVNKPADSTYVNYYGADPTGTTDSSAAIQECIDANIGGCIRFKSGTYLISEPITTKYVESNNNAQRTSIDFQGATIIPTAEMPCVIYLNGDHSGERATRMHGAYIKNGFIFNRDELNVNIGILCEYYLCSNMLIDNMTMKHVAPTAIKFNSNDAAGVSTDILVTNCMFMRSQPSDADDSIAFDLKGAKDNKIINCRAYGYQYGFTEAGGLFAIQNHLLVRPGNNTFWENSAFAFANSGAFYMCYADGYKIFANAGQTRNFNLYTKRCVLHTPSELDLEYYVLKGYHINSINSPMEISVSGEAGRAGFYLCAEGTLSASQGTQINTNQFDCKCTMPPVDTFDLAYSSRKYISKWKLEQSYEANKYYLIGRLFVANINHEPFSFRIVNVEQKMLHDVLGEVNAITGTLLYRMSGSRMYVTGTKTSNVNYVVAPRVINNISYLDIYMVTEGALSSFSLPEIVAINGCISVPVHTNDNGYNTTYLPESFDTIDMTNALTLFS